MKTFVRFVAGFLVLAVIGCVLFVKAVDHPHTRGPLRCWLTETFYDLSSEPVPPHTPVVEAVQVTAPVKDMCDAADDPAIWINPDAPEKSLILGTNKQERINVYDLDGNLLNHTDDIGEPNNVDIRVFNSQILAVSSNKDTGSFDVFELNSNNHSFLKLNETGFPVEYEDEVYGLCLYQTEQDLFVFTTDKSGLIVQQELHQENNVWVANPIRTLRVESQPEACVVDDAEATLFIGEEDIGIWSFEADPNGSLDGQLIAQVGSIEPLKADVEGLALYQTETAKAGYLIASSQGDNSYVVFDRLPPHNFRGKFQISYNGRIIQDTDGLDMVSSSISTALPRGLLVVQDGAIRDTDGKRRNQGFAYVSWKDIELVLGLQDDR